jgi:hypothetical protein
MTPQVTPAPPPIPKPLSEPSRLIGVFVSPGSTFPDIVRRPRWWIPMILLGIMATIVAVEYGRHVGWERVVRQSIERNPRMDQVSAQQREQIIAAGTRVASYVGYAAGMNGAISILVVSAVLIFLFNVLMSADLKFPSVMGIVGYSFLPLVVSGALTLVVMLMKDPEDFDIQRPLAFNLGAFLPDSMPRWAIVGASSFDLFSFWVIALMAIGISSSVRRVSFSKAFITILFPWALVVILRVAITALGLG